MPACPWRFSRRCSYASVCTERTARLPRPRSTRCSCGPCGVRFSASDKAGNRMPYDRPAPLISVVIPCYNAEAYLAQAIESALRQEAGLLEVVVIDDGSTDGSAGVARHFGGAVRYEYQANAGISAARNRGVELSVGRYLAFLDADDVWPEGSLQSRVDILRVHPGTACVFGAVEEFVSPDLHEDSGSRIRLAHPAQPARLAGSMLIEREAFLRVGFFDPRLTVGETIDWVE